MVLIYGCDQRSGIVVDIVRPRSIRYLSRNPISRSMWYLGGSYKGGRHSPVQRLRPGFQGAYSLPIVGYPLLLELKVRQYLGERALLVDSLGILPKLRIKETAVLRKVVESAYTAYTTSDISNGTTS